MTDSHATDPHTTDSDVTDPHAGGGYRCVGPSVTTAYRHTGASGLGPVTVIDETIREGMQYQGVVFALAQRYRILDFQERLGVDLCQAGYPPAHPGEAAIVRDLVRHARQHRYRIRVAGMGRAMTADADTLLDCGVDDLHFHWHLPPGAGESTITDSLARLVPVLTHVRARKPEAGISLAMLDLGRTPWQTLSLCIDRLCPDRLIDILSLPDTSGIMAPNQVSTRIRQAVQRIRQGARAMVKTTADSTVSVSVHCHNDLGMASANSVMGILAGARGLEVSALGIGERNGIADLYTTIRVLADQGVTLSIRQDDIATLTDYYAYVDNIVREQTGQGLISPRTPGFGRAVFTHVAGTHAAEQFGTGPTQEIFLNLLCGNGLVKKYLTRHHIPFLPETLPAITRAVKERSLTAGRRLHTSEIRRIASSVR